MKLNSTWFVSFQSISYHKWQRRNFKLQFICLVKSNHQNKKCNKLKLFCLPLLLFLLLLQVLTWNLLTYLKRRKTKKFSKLVFQPKRFLQPLCAIYTKWGSQNGKLHLKLINFSFYINHVARVDENTIKGLQNRALQGHVAPPCKRHLQPS